MVLHNMRDLQAAVEARITQCLREKIEPMMRDIIQRNTQANVYDVYDPMVYRRRGTNGGMLDTRNYVAEYDGMSLYMYNRAPASRRSFDPLVYRIEYGYGAQDRPYNIGRPSMYPSQVELNARRGEIEGFLRQSLK